MVDFREMPYHRPDIAGYIEKFKNATQHLKDSKVFPQ